MNWFSNIKFGFIKISNSTDISPQNIYDFYYITYLLQTKKQMLEQIDLFEIYSKLEEIKNKYLVVLKQLIKEQLEKYQTRKRIDYIDNKPAFDLNKLEELDNEELYKYLDQAMKQTYRSDMERRNVNWEYLTENLSGLASTNNPEKIIYYIDRLNNAIHNTYTSTLEKLPRGYNIVEALDNCHTLSPQKLKQYVSSFLRKIRI